MLPRVQFGPVLRRRAPDYAVHPCVQCASLGRWFSTFLDPGHLSSNSSPAWKMPALSSHSFLGYSTMLEQVSRCKALRKPTARNPLDSSCESCFTPRSADTAWHPTAPSKGSQGTPGCPSPLVGSHCCPSSEQGLPFNYHGRCPPSATAFSLRPRRGASQKKGTESAKTIFSWLRLQKTPRFLFPPRKPRSLERPLGKQGCISAQPRSPATPALPAPAGSVPPRRVSGRVVPVNKSIRAVPRGHVLPSIIPRSTKGRML